MVLFLTAFKTCFPFSFTGASPHTPTEYMIFKILVIEYSTQSQHQFNQQHKERKSLTFRNLYLTGHYAMCEHSHISVFFARNYCLVSLHINNPCSFPVISLEN